MGWIDWTFSVATIVVAIILTIVVMLQNTKNGSSTVTGDSNTFYGANKNKTLDGTLSKYTVILSIMFIVLCVCTTISIIK